MIEGLFMIAIGWVMAQGLALFLDSTMITFGHAMTIFLVILAICLLLLSGLYIWDYADKKKRGEQYLAQIYELKFVISAIFGGRK